MNMEVQASVLLALSEYINPAMFQQEELVGSDLADIVNDSLSILEVVYDLEEIYNITIEPENLTKLQTVSDLVQAIDQKVNPAFR